MFKRKILISFICFFLLLAGCSSESRTTKNKIMHETTIPTDYEGKVDLNATNEKFVIPLIPTGTILLSSWETADDIPASQLIQFCSFNNLLNKELTPSDSAIRFGAEYIDNLGAADEVEKAIQEYFDVSSDYLRTAVEYEMEKSGYYLLGSGFGGGGSIKTLNAATSWNILTLTVGIYGPDDVGTPSITGILIIELIDDGFRYISYFLQ